MRVPSHPAAVVVDPTFASTVLDGVWRGGIGEIVRFAAVSDGALMKRVAKDAQALKARDAGAMAGLVESCVAARAKKGPTDFALWSAARLEAMSAYKLPHGYAVPIGVCIDSAYAVERKMLKAADQELICGALAECGALDGLAHSSHLLAQAESITFGLDAWRLSTGSSAITLPAGVGKSKVDESPDRETFKKVIKEFLDVSAQC
jgi:3-dehydroquinate synthase